MSAPGTPPTFEIRPARPEDVPAIHAMIGALAAFEKLDHLRVATETDLADGAVRPAAGGRSAHCM